MDRAGVVRLSISGRRFEVLVDPEMALRLKMGKEVDMDELLAYPAIYRDARKSEKAAEEDLQRFFGTSDVFKIARRIVKEGEVQLTIEQRRRMIEQKRNQIASIIAKRGIDPRTNSPHPAQRILAAMEKCGIRVDPFVEAELQIEDVLKKIKEIIPIKFQRITLELKIPPQYAGKSISLLRRFGSIKKERWLSDGSLEASLEILAGMQAEFFQKISGLTHGQFESKIEKKVDLSTT